MLRPQTTPGGSGTSMSNQCWDVSTNTIKQQAPGSSASGSATSGSTARHVSDHARLDHRRREFRRFSLDRDNSSEWHAELLMRRIVTVKAPPSGGFSVSTRKVLSVCVKKPEAPVLDSAQAHWEGAAACGTAFQMSGWLSPPGLRPPQGKRHANMQHCLASIEKLRRDAAHANRDQDQPDKRTEFPPRVPLSCILGRI